MSTRQRRIGPSYDEEQYWDEKFTRADDIFEWLGSGDVLLEAARKYCLSQKAERPPQILHLGAGTSTLCLDIARDLQRIYPKVEKSLIAESISNVDFSQIALNISKKQATQDGLDGMQYIKVDLRDWADISSKQLFSERNLFDIIIDKSTSDAISTNAKISLKAVYQASLCPFFFVQSDNDYSLLDPLDVVATHLAALSKPGCIWAVLSYSANRFDFLTCNSSISQRYWTVVSKQHIEVPCSSANPHAPAIYHYFYQLQRNSDISHTYTNNECH